MKGRRRVAGLHAVESALRHHPERIVAAWVDTARADSRLTALIEILDRQGIRPQSANRSRLGTLAEGESHHQGIVIELTVSADLGENELRTALESLGPMPLFLVLDHVQDPHNLGACLRTADAAGVQGVITTKDQAAGLSPVVAKVASGAAESVPLYRVTNLARSLEWLKAAGLWIVGAAGEARKTIYETDLNLPMALVMGAEGKGMRRLTRENCDLLVKIPMAGTVESLNVSVATGVLLFEAVRQRSRSR
jgi:23S rRNA (guanosine2251-2'-O)-methyltransferase